MLQDSRGFLWLATFQGLARFDSVHFDPQDASLKAAGASRRVRALAETRELGLICAPDNGGLFTLQHENWQRLPSIGEAVINALFTEADGTLWASGDDRVLRRIAGGKVESFPVAALGSARPDAYFASDADKKTWVATGGFLGRFENGNFIRDLAGLQSQEFRIASSREGGPWVATRDRLHKLTHGVADEGFPLPTLLGAHYIRTMFEDRRGVLWIGTRSQGLYTYRNGELAAVQIPSDEVRSICEDAEGNIWVGTNGGGIVRLRERDFRLYDQSSGLRDNFSHTICEDDAGVIWLANRDGGVARYNDGKIDLIAQRLGWRHFNAMSITPDGAGKLWVTSGVGVFKIDPAKGQLARDPELQSTKLIRATYVARNGDYWFTLDPNRVGRSRDGQVDYFGAEEGLVGTEIRCFAENSTGEIWVGTTDGKIFRTEGEKFSAVDLALPPGIGSVQSILFESDDVVWIGTSQAGLAVLSRGRTRIFDQRNGLADDCITDMIRDDSGRFWFGSNSGIFSVQAEALTSLREGKVERVQSLRVGRDDTTVGLTCLGMFKPSTLKDRSGRIWFTTRKGVLMFDPATVNTDVLSPPVFLSEVKTDGKRQPLGATLSLSAQVRKTELRLSVLRFSAPEHVQIRYRLVGFDNDWIDAGPDRIATYPALPPGDYRFEAISSLSNGVWNEEGITLDVTVVPRWWQTWWFIAFGVTTAIAAITLIVRAWSHRRLRQHLERLERESAIERERTRIARDIHDDLGAGLARISLLTQSARLESGPTSTAPLPQIYDAVSEITRSMDEIVWAVNPRHDRLESLADYLASFTHGLLSAAGIRCRLDVPPQLPSVHLSSQVRHNLYLCLKEIIHNVARHSGATEVHLRLEAVDGELRITVRDDGRGFDPAAPRPTNTERPAGGNGLGNIQRRMEDISGRCVVRSQPGAGTEIALSLPCQISPAPHT